MATVCPHSRSLHQYALRHQDPRQGTSAPAVYSVICAGCRPKGRFLPQSLKENLRTDRFSSNWVSIKPGAYHPVDSFPLTNSFDLTALRRRRGKMKSRVHLENNHAAGGRNPPRRAKFDTDAGNGLEESKNQWRAPGRNRTYDQLLRRQLLYPLSYRGQRYRLVSFCLT